MNKNLIIISVLVLLFVGIFVYKNNIQNDDFVFDNSLNKIKKDDDRGYKKINKNLEEIVLRAKNIEDEVKKEEILTPVYIELLEEYKICLNQAATKNNAIKCIDLMNKRVKELEIKKDDDGGGYEEEKSKIGNWTDVEKDEMIKKIDIDLSLLNGS